MSSSCCPYRNRVHGIMSSSDPNPAPQPAGVPSAPVLTAWPTSAQLAAAFLLGVVTTLLAVYAYSSSRTSTRPSDLQRGSENAYRVDLNHAERAELMQLPGVGDALADRVLEHRRQHGPFRNVDDLRTVSGMGPATLERLRPHIQVTADDPEAEEMPAPNLSPSPTRSTGKKESSLKEPIDINRATLDDLQRLPGIGPKMAQRILDERQKKPFEKIEDLRRVSGIGPKTLEKLRPCVKVGTPSNPRVAASD